SEASPGARAEGAMRQEEEERREGEQVDDVAAVDHALREAVEVVEERELEEGGRDARADRRLVPGGEPGEDEDAVGEHGAHHLVLAHGGGGRAAGDEGDAEEDQAGVARKHGRHREGVESVEERGADGRRGEHAEVERQRGEDPGERPAAHGSQLAPADEKDFGHGPSPSAATRARNASSSEVSTGASARSPQPLPVTRAASSARASRPGSSSTRQRAWPFACM